MRKVKNCLAARGGMTLVEVVVSMAILALAAFVMTSAVGAGTSSVLRAKMRERSVDEALRAEESAPLPAAYTDTLIIQTPDGNVPVSGRYQLYTSGSAGSITVFTPNPEGSLPVPEGEDP